MSSSPRPASRTISAATCGALLLFAPTLLHAVQCDGGPPLRGQILDAATLIPLVGAEVQLSYRPEGERRDRSQTVVTGAGGAFEACGIPAGASVRVQARYSLEQSTPQHVTFTDGQRVRIAMATPHSVLSGRVVDSGGSPLGSAAVRVDGTPLEMVTGADGRFRFPRVPPGDYQLSVQHIGYRALIDTVRIDLSATVDVTVPMHVDAVPLEALTVTTRSFHLDRVGFYTRRERMPGAFVTRAEFADRRPAMASDMLRGLAGIRLQPRRGNVGNMPLGRGNCGFRYVVDGTRIGPGFEIDDIRPDWIEAIEIYRGASEVPGEFTGPMTDPRANCGVIVVWTRVR